MKGYHNESKNFKWKFKYCRKKSKKIQKIKKISQPEICRKLDLLGVTMYYCDIYEIEHGKKTVKDFGVLAFCKVLEITLEDLYSDTDKYYEE